MPRKIETGVDRLVVLVNKKKKIELGQAAKELGVSKTVVQEWAEFLEEQGLLSVEYSLSKTYLVERQLTEKELDSKKMEYGTKKEAFVRKVESTLQTLESESTGFQQMKEKFFDLQKEIGSEIEKVKNEVKELRHYEDLKKNLDQEILQQKIEFQKMFDDLHKQIKFEEKKYDSIVEDVQREKSKISEEKLDIDYMEKKEDNIKRRIEALKEILSSLEKEVDLEKGELDQGVKKLEELNVQADSLMKEIEEKKKEDLKPLVEKSDEAQEKIMRIQEDIISKVRDQKEKLGEYETEGDKIAQEFDNFFKKKATTEKLLEAVEGEKSQLQDEFQDLINSAKAFQLASKSADISKHIGKLEDKYGKLQKLRSKFREDLHKLTQKVLGGK